MLIIISIILFLFFLCNLEGLKVLIVLLMTIGLPIAVVLYFISIIR